ncbi:hypothetical protein CC80DRAFT_404938 [Byssothecium circinans]|uniref:Heterokaryon incompatibility domain-containing protein n=1 Tax=Byssothecium circinans TaxID=147558 RepID=A0A6A5U6K2_9PLEO|nr:hypothetical protein CC80DRAFT_404938 [Byssothecium circinans]
MAGKNEIRILVLAPASQFSDPLQLHMICRKLWDWDSFEGDLSCPSYRAVSYCWGKAAGTSTFRCEGKSLLVTPTVESMLRHLRKINKPLRLWIDAICINQQDMDEKGKQVASMEDVYARADKTYVWFGQASIPIHILLPNHIITYDHRTMKIALPVRSAVLKHRTGGLVVR